MRTLLCAVGLTFVATTTQAQAVWTGPVGGGMLAVQEAAVLETGHFALGGVVDNYDRNHPLGIDVVDASVAFRLGGPFKGMELYGRYPIARAVSVPGTQEVPPSPLDIVVLDARLAPRGAYRGVYWPMPYLGDYPAASVSDMTPGEYTFGLKVGLGCQRRWRPALSVSLQTTIPGTMSSDALAHGSGSGGADMTLQTAATWRYRRLSLSANAGYTLTGSMKRPDRIVLAQVDPPYIDELPGTRPDLAIGGVGARVRIWRGISAFGEFYGWAPVGSRQATVDDGPATDILAGMEFRYRAIGLTLGVRQHLNVPRDGQASSSGEMGGALDLSGLSDGRQRQYLADIGVDQSAHRPGANLVIIGGRPYHVPDPDGSRRIPGVHYNHTTGNTGLIGAISVSF